MTNLVEFSSANLPSELGYMSTGEREAHRDLVLRNIDFLIDLLAAECVRSNRRMPVGCPQATPEALSRGRDSRSNRGKFPCQFAQFVHQPTGGEKYECCSDPLCDSDDPLDAVAAVCIANDGKLPEERYRDYRWRKLVDQLRADHGTWVEIAAIEESQLARILESYTDGLGFNSERAKRLKSLLQEVQEYPRSDGVSLMNLPGIQYETLAKDLAGFTGISKSDAWWLLLTTFEKPIWPSSPRTDAALCSLGLLTAEEYEVAGPRRGEIEDLFPDRTLPTLHRMLSAHTTHAGASTCGSSCPVRKFLLPYRLNRQDESVDRDRPTAVDLFAGAGGFSTGLREAGFDVRFAVDHSESATDTYRLNHPEIPHESIRTEDINKTVESGFFDQIDEDIDVVIGGPPCQALSLAGYRSRLSEEDDYDILEDSRTTLYQSYIDVLEYLVPEIVIMENVEGMISEIGDTGIKVADMVIDGLSSAGYDASLELIDCSEFGIPQTRKRVIIIGVRRASGWVNASPNELLEQVLSHRVAEKASIRQALAGLPRLKRGEGGCIVPRQLRGPRSDFQKRAGIESDTGYVYNHLARKHPKKKDRKLFDEVMLPGMDSADVIHGTEHGDLIDYDVGTEENPRFRDKYRMLDWNEPSPTIVAHLQKDANSFILPDYHRQYSFSSRDACPERNRGITPREAARIQSFSDDFMFLGAFTDWFQQIGNAVPPYIGKILGEVAKNALTHSLEIETASEGIQTAAGSDD